MVARRVLYYCDGVVLAVADEFIPPAFFRSPKTPRVDEVQKLTCDGAVRQGKISTSDNGDAALRKRQPIKEVNQFNQFHDVNRATLPLEKLARHLIISRFGQIKKEIHACHYI